MCHVGRRLSVRHRLAARMTRACPVYDPVLDFEYLFEVNKFDDADQIVVLQTQKSIQTFITFSSPTAISGSRCM